MFVAFAVATVVFVGFALLPHLRVESWRGQGECTGSGGMTAITSRTPVRSALPAKLVYSAPHRQPAMQLLKYCPLGFES
jgi:hypothetical protein